MEVKINKEIRNYTENIYFGLNLRQFIFSLLGVIVEWNVYGKFIHSIHKVRDTYTKTFI